MHPSNGPAQSALIDDVPQKDAEKNKSSTMAVVNTSVLQETKSVFMLCSCTPVVQCDQVIP